MTTATALEATQDAERILRSVWQQDAPRLPLPVDPVRIARRFGIGVYEVPLDQDVYAALVKEPGQDPTILLNASDARNRKRFSCAHELGHFLRHPEDEYEYVDHRNILSSGGTEPEEIYANSFAAALLMPESEVHRLHKAGATEYEMALFFDVSREALSYRLKNLGLRASG
jgi:Zn-dependent peptidase ImmA (M78 family)